jgi:nucleotide-binding universal stress UspA family protein
MDIVVGYVRNKEGQAALNRGIEEARVHGARLTVVHSSRGGGHESVEDVITDRDELERIDAELVAAGVDHQIREVVLGHTPAVDIIDVANEIGAELIVIGIRRRSPVGKLLLGSEAQEILLLADCAVLAVKPHSAE